MTDELLPCPAECLHTVDRGPPSVFSRRRDIWGVYCQTCQCSTEYYPTADEAITAWNTRTPQSDVDKAGSRVLHDKVYAEARDRHMRDATQSGFEHHLIQVAAEHGARIALAARIKTVESDDGCSVCGHHAPPGDHLLSCAASDETHSEELENGKAELKRLIESIWRAEYRDTAPHWEPLPDLVGMVTQIDNMYAGLRSQRDESHHSAQPQWQPIETAPRDGTEIIAHDKITKTSHVTLWDGYRWHDPDHHYYSEHPDFCPTHWAPVPPLPGDQS